MKGVPERVDESDVQLVSGGTCHTPNDTSESEAHGLTCSATGTAHSQAIYNDTSEGEGGVNTPTGTECNIVFYETDEEEFTRPEFTKREGTVRHDDDDDGTARQKIKPKKPKNTYNLGYLGMWWRRMAREAEKEELERKKKEGDVRRREKMKNWLKSKKDELRERKYMKGLEQVSSSEDGPCSDDVTIPAKHQPTQCDVQDGGGRIFTGDMGIVGEGGRGVVVKTSSDNVIFERSQPIVFSKVTNEHHHDIGTDADVYNN